MVGFDPDYFKPEGATLHRSSYENDDQKDYSWGRPENFSEPFKSELEKLIDFDLKDGSVSVSGTPSVGSTLTASSSGWKPEGGTTTYKWFRNGASISGATSSTYKLVEADGGKKVKVQATYSLEGYPSGTVTSSEVSVPVPTAP